MCAIGLLIGACGESNSSETSGEVVTQEPEKVEKTYESVLSDYTLQIQNAVPNLINEFNTEADASDGSIESLAEISNNKVQDLAKFVMMVYQKWQKSCMTKVMNMKCMKNGQTNFRMFI